jgi:hypothetical protein
VGRTNILGGTHMAFEFKRAERTQVKVRIAMIGPSGSGKTYSALRLAKGMGGKTALIDTENRRSEYYATEFDFDVLQLNPPFTPERYIEAITAAESAGYDNLIIDSISHEWMGTGGLLQDKDKMTDKNDFTKWGKLTPRHDRFIDKIVRCNLHLIVTLRGKDEYVLTSNENGKQTPKKIGMGAQQRDGLEYECTVSFMMDQEKHVAEVMKDNTHLFEGKYDVLTEEHGKLLKQWASEGIDVPKPVPKISFREAQDLFILSNSNAVIVREVVTKYKYTSTQDITVLDYPSICEEIKLRVEEIKPNE